MLAVDTWAVAQEAFAAAREVSVRGVSGPVP